MQGDVSKPDDIRRLFGETKRAFGRLEILVNNAGVYNFAPLEQITPEHFHKQFDLNVLGLLLATQEAVKHFGDAGGSVVNLSSVVARESLPGAAVYSATKAAVDAATRIARRRTGAAPHPGQLGQPRHGHHRGQHHGRRPRGRVPQAIRGRASLGRVGGVDDIAPAVVFLASDDSKWITGESLYITGGYR